MPTLDDVVDVIAKQAGLDPKALASGASLKDLGLTSYAMMRLVIELEDHFSCELETDDLDRVFTIPVSGIVEALERSAPTS